MTQPSASERFDWRIWLGLVLTGAWLTLGGAYISASIGWGRVGSLDAATLGNFLEGAFAPLAFLWLVIGYFLQRKELEQNTEALRAQSLEIQRTADQAIIQSERMAASERHAHQEAFLRLADTVGNQLGAIAGLLFVSSQGANADGSVSNEEMSKLFSTASAQDPEIFSRRLLELHLRESDPGKRLDLFYGTEVRARHTNNFIHTCERLFARAEEVDSDNILRDALMASGHGFVYRVMKLHQANAPRELADMRVTGTHIDL
ncbi:MAG: hypothetical protein OXF68_16285 [Gammaproteobacteria bacterium]|nr:hypothetical protein [Gammaproteobacteria bacterium]